MWYLRNMCYANSKKCQKIPTILMYPCFLKILKTLLILMNLRYQ